MPTLAWIVLLGTAMSGIAMVGSVALLLSEETLNRLLGPLVALAAGSLLGGAFLHVLPDAIDELGNRTSVWVWFLAGFTTFFLLEQILHWHHCHRTVSKHRPLGHLILIADGLHNTIGGLAVASAFFIDHRVGVVTWAAAAAHEVPQELGDFGILVNSGWTKRKALAYNFVSGLTFLVGGLAAYAMSGSVNIVFLVPFAAGNFAYIGATDLLPELTTEPLPDQQGNDLRCVHRRGGTALGHSNHLQIVTEVPGRTIAPLLGSRGARHSHDRSNPRGHPPQPVATSKPAKRPDRG